MRSNRPAETAVLLLLALLLVAVPGAAAGRRGAGGGSPTKGPEIEFADPPRLLRAAAPEDAGLDGETLAGIGQVLAGAMTADPRPRFPGAVVLAAVDGMVVYEQAAGHALRYADAAPTELPADRRLPVRAGTVFDIASLSKLLTAAVAMQLAERGELELDAPVARWLPAFAAGGKEQVTVRQLLSHTSGLPAYRALYREQPTPEDRIAAVYATPPLAEPGTTYRYSDLNMITLGKVVEAAGGAPLDVQVAERVTGPLGMRDTRYDPPGSWRHRTAATEDQRGTGRGLLWGEVHDENAWSLGGVAGHAGAFSTARDLAVFAQMLLNGGVYAGARVLQPETVREMLTSQPGTGGDRGLGLELNQPSYMGALASPVTAGHTGFTGTSLVLDPAGGRFVILLTNRVHPSRDWGSVQPDRRAVADVLAAAGDPAAAT